jgi:hypothetical protein
MAVTTSGTITFQQADIVNGKTVRFNETMHIPRVSSLDALRTFAAVLEQYTDAAIVAISFSWEESQAIESSGDAPLDTLATLLLHGEPGKTKSKNLAVFAAKESMFELIRGQGLLVKRSVGQALTDAYSDLTGETFTFVRGRLQR